MMFSVHIQTYCVTFVCLHEVCLSRLWIPFQRCEEDKKQCIPVFWYCNGKPDCPQGSDEFNCKCEQYNMRKCTTAANTTLCASDSWIYKGYISCQNIDPNSTTPNATSMHNNIDVAFCHLDFTWVAAANVCDEKTNNSGAQNQLFCLGECVFW